MSPAPKIPESRLQPLSAGLSAREARDAYFAENGFSVAIYDARFTDATLLGMRFRIPNTARHRWAIMRHDLHHAATGYGTDLYGEIEVSAWECRRGLRPLGLYVGGIVLGLALLGCLVAPRRTLRAWRAGPGKESLFHISDDYDEILALPLGKLRERLDLPEDGLWRGPRMLNPNAPGNCSKQPNKDAANPAVAPLLQVSLLLGGLAAYLFVSETGSGRDDGYALVVAIHLALLALGCVAVSVRLLTRSRSRTR